MADKKYAVIRTDLLSGTQQIADLMSVKFFGGDDQPAEVENGVIAKIDSLLEGEREVYKVKAAKNTDPMSSLVIIGNPEIMYDERKVNLTEYINEKGKIVRAYIPRSRNIFSLSKEGFETGKEPTVGSEVGVGEGGKLNKEKKGFGKCIAIEPAGMVTYYVIEIGLCETAPQE